MSESTPDPRQLVDPDDPGGLIDGGAVEMPGVQDRGFSEESADAPDLPHRDEE